MPTNSAEAPNFLLIVDLAKSQGKFDVGAKSEIHEMDMCTGDAQVMHCISGCEVKLTVLAKYSCRIEINLSF